MLLRMDMLLEERMAEGKEERVVGVVVLGNVGSSL
jgi:hypothetical protein